MGGAVFGDHAEQLAYSETGERAFEALRGVFWTQTPRHWLLIPIVSRPQMPYRVMT